MKWRVLLTLLSIAFAIPFAPVPAHAQVTSYIVVVTLDGELFALDSPTGTRVGESISTNQADSLALTPDGRFAMVAGSGSCCSYVDFVDVGTRTSLGTADIDSHRNVSAGAVSPDGTRLYLTVNQNLVVIDVATRAQVGEFPNCGISVAVAPDGRHVYCSDLLDGVRVFDVEQQRIIRTIPMPSSNSVDIAITPDGLLAYVAGNAIVTPIDLRTHTPLPSIPMARTPYRLAISPDGRFVYVTADNFVYVIYRRTQSVIATLEVGQGLRTPVITPDGATVYIVSFARPYTTEVIDVIGPAMTQRSGASGARPSTSAPTFSPRACR